MSIRIAPPRARIIALPQTGSPIAVTKGAYATQRWRSDGDDRGVRMSSLPRVAGLTWEKVAREFDDRGPEVCRTEITLDL